MSEQPGAASRSTQTRGVHDVAALAKQVIGFDADRYFDSQEQIEYRGALERWPVLARLMGLVDVSQARHVSAAHESKQPQHT